MFSRLTIQSRIILRSKIAQARRFAHATSNEQQDPIESFVRKYLPENEHIALGVLGLYTTLYLTYKLCSLGGKKKPAAAAIEAPSHGKHSSSSSSIPSSDSENLGDWLGQDGNFEKFIVNLESQ